MFRLSLLALLVGVCSTANSAPGDLGKPDAFGGIPVDRVVVRGNSRHPCVNLTESDVLAARGRIKQFGWAKEEGDRIVRDATSWLQHSDEYWLSFLPRPGAAYAYGFSGCPICGGRTGTWAEANCSWELPGKVKCENGHLLPDTNHLDDGTGYKAPDGRIHYFVGQFNAWVTEQWTTAALPVLAQAYLLTGDERYARRGALLLDALASIYKESTAGSWDYPSNPTSGRLARPWYQVSRTLVIYTDVYDWLYHSSALDRPSLRPNFSRRANIEKNLLLDGARYCYERSWGGRLSNGHADYLRGALAVGCLMDIPAYIDAAVNGPFSIKMMLANDIDRNGLYYETAPNYAIHARHLYLTYAEPLFNLRTQEYPKGINLFDSAGLAETLTLPELQLQMQGRRPNYGDVAPAPGYQAVPAQLFNSTDYEFAERLMAKTTDEHRRREYAAIVHRLTGGDLDTYRGKYGTNWALWHATEPVGGETVLPDFLEHRIAGSWFAGMSGLALLRTPGQSALLRYGPTLNHGDPDDLGLQYYAAGYELSYDIGYGLSSTHTQVGWASSSVSHALVTVNEKNQVTGGNGSGGSLIDFVSLPSVRFVDADSPLSYAAEHVRTYRRAVALVDGGYMVDCFHVEGGRQHDYGFGSIGTELEPFGVNAITFSPGSLAPGIAWGECIGPDGNIVGYPNKPGWNPPPGNGYGFFYNLRHAQPKEKVWGGVWTVRDAENSPSGGGGVASGQANPHVAKLRLFMAGDNAEPVYANAPGLYPRLPAASYILARRRGENLKSTFLAVYEPFAEGKTGPAPRLGSVSRLGERALSIHRVDGAEDVVLFGSFTGETPFGRISFTGRFAYLMGNGASIRRAELLGCNRLEAAGRVLVRGRGIITAKITEVDSSTCRVKLDATLPSNLKGLTAVFFHPKWTRTSGYRIARTQGSQMWLEARTLSLGLGRASRREGSRLISSDIPHEFAQTAMQTPTRIFDGKVIVGSGGGATRITSVKPGAPLILGVLDGNTIGADEVFEYRDLVPGDAVTIALPEVWSNDTPVSVSSGESVKEP